jgi:hypothetical protein
MNTDPHKALRDDVRLLGELFGETLRRREGETLYALIEEVRALAKRAHADDAHAFHELADRLSELPLDAAVPLARAFAQFLTLANIAEQHHRVRRRREYARDPAHRPQPVVRRRVRAVARQRLVVRGAGRRGPLAADRAGAHRASDRDRPPHAAAGVSPHRRRARGARSPGPGAGRIRRRARRAAP